MYLPPAFREDRPDVLHGLIRSHPLGLIVTGGPGGLMANPVPFLLFPEEGEQGVLRAHLSRANPQWTELGVVQECLVVFQGPDSYVSPAWYATKQETGKVVPTWNYVTVHVWGALRVEQDAAWLRRHLEQLTAAHEGSRTAPWRLEDAPRDYLEAQIRGIVGVEIPIHRMEGKWKVSQNRAEADRRGVVEGLRGQGGASSDAMAALVEERA